MPIYEYRCSVCNHYLEALQNLRDEPLVKCPNCNKRKLKKLISAPRFQLKGTGWYATDFKNPPKKEENKNPTESKEPAKKSTETSTDAAVS